MRSNAERNPDGGQRTLRDCVFQRFSSELAASCAAFIIALPRSENGRR